MVSYGTCHYVQQRFVKRSISKFFNTVTMAHAPPSGYLRCMQMVAGIEGNCSGLLWHTSLCAATLTHCARYYNVTYCNGLALYGRLVRLIRNNSVWRSAVDAGVRRWG